MTTNAAFNQDQIITTEKENSTNLGADTYGTFPDGTDSIPTTTTTTTTSFQSYPYGISSETPTVILLGGCPACKTGKLETDFTCLGLCCAIFFFPIGIICCFAFRQHRCNYCGAIFP